MRYLVRSFQEHSLLPGPFLDHPGILGREFAPEPMPPEVLRYLRDGAAAHEGVEHDVAHARSGEDARLDERGWECGEMGVGERLGRDRPDRATVPGISDRPLAAEERPLFLRIKFFG